MQRLSNVFSSSFFRFSPIASLHAPSWTILSRQISAAALPCRVQARCYSAQFPSMVAEIIDDGLKNRREARPVQTVEDRWRDRSKKALEDAKVRPPAHAYTGRTVEVTKDLSLAYKQLDTILSRNHVRQTLRLTERHEKKGVKRRRLRSERWRKQFANEVRKKVQLVVKIRDRGA